jgi:hypothetical protein
LPLMIEINLWADKYLEIPVERNEIVKEIKKDKEAFIKSMIKELKK